MRRTSDAVEILEYMIRDDPEAQFMLREARLLSTMAQIVYDARIQAGLSQEELAKRAGLEVDVIEQIEVADSGFDGPLLEIVQRITLALGKRLEMRLVPEEAFAELVKA